MFSIILFAMIGSIIKATTAYWVVYAIFCILESLRIVCRVMKAIVAIAYHN